MPGDVVLQACAVTKRFGGVAANDRVDFSLRQGEIHALLGENGAGKTTLMNILCGLYRPDEGSVRHRGERVRLRSPRDAMKIGIHMVHQHFMLVPPFTVAENVVLGAEPSRWGRLDRPAARDRVRRLARRHGLAVDVDAPVETLPVGLQQRVEILKALFRRARILILDEPTAVLAPQETEALFAALRGLRDRGTTILLITRRLAAIYDRLEQPGLRERLVAIAPRPALAEEILWVHAPEYLNRIAATEGRDQVHLSPDTLASERSYPAALGAAGGVLEAVARVVRGELANAFALVRPPGHHAERSRAMGYCIFNNVALGAAYARQALGIRRVLIVDWDVHHGNGTQHAFESRADVLFFSVHQHPHFPGTGMFTESGRGAGEGYTVNLPLPKGYADAEYAALFETLLRPVVLEFGPGLILVSAGFDTHGSDPLGGMRMTASVFAALTRSLMAMADLCCGGRLVLCLEGGYHVEATADSVAAVLGEMAGLTRSEPAGLAQQARPRQLAYAVDRYRHVQRRFWKSLA